MHKNSLFVRFCAAAIGRLRSLSFKFIVCLIKSVITSVHNRKTAEIRWKRKLKGSVFKHLTSWQKL
jgi:hypothetical protein